MEASHKADKSSKALRHESTGDKIAANLSGIAFSCDMYDHHLASIKCNKKLIKRASMFPEDGEMFKKGCPFRASMPNLDNCSG